MSGDYRPRSRAMHLLMAAGTRSGRLALEAVRSTTPGSPERVAASDARTSADDARAALTLSLGVHPDDVDPVGGMSSAAPTVRLPCAGQPPAAPRRKR